MLMAFFSWWYTTGWARQLSRTSERLASLFDYFSFELLLHTLFSPYRQISAGRVDGPLGVRLQAVFDRFISRIIGGMIRIVLLLVGVLTIIVVSIFALVELAIWPLIPLFPLIGALLSAMGWLT